MKRYPILLIFLLLTDILFAQTLKWKGDQDFINIAEQIEVLEDKTGYLNLLSIASGKYDSQFNQSGQSVIHRRFTESIHWFRFSFENNSADSLWLVLENGLIPQTDFFFMDSSGSWKSYNSGYEVLIKNKIVKNHFQIFPLLKGKHDYYIRLVPLMHPIPVKVWNSKTYQVKAARQQLIYGIYAGILLFAVAVNIFLFFSLNKLYYLFYSLLIFLYLCSSSFMLEGFAIYFFPTLNLMYWYKVLPVLDMPALLIYCLFFLDLKKYSSTLNKIIWTVIGFLLLYVVALHFIPLLPAMGINYLLSLIVFVLVIYISLSVGKKQLRRKMGYYFAIAYSFWFLFVFLELTYIQWGVPTHFFDLSYVSIAMFLEAFLLAFLLAKRFKWEKEDDADIRFELQSNIIQIHKEFEKQKLQARLEIQEQTLDRISQEIHDNIGQTLSLVKLNLYTINTDIETKDKHKLEESKELVAKSIRDLRDIAKAMNSEHVLGIGLAEAIEQQLKSLQKTGIFNTKLLVEGTVEKYDSTKELFIYRVVQELLNNIVKHADAKNIEISIGYSSDNLSIYVKDDGIGFNVDTVVTSNDKGLGLRNILSRIKLINGTVSIKSDSRIGTLVTVVVPKTTINS